MILLDTPPQDAKATLSQLLLGKTEPADSEAFGKILQELSLSLGKGKGLSNDELALLLAKEGEEQESKVTPGLLLKLGIQPDGKSPHDKTNDALLSLLHGDEEEAALNPEELKDTKALHPKITAELPVKEVRQLMESAKNYLTSQLSDLVEESEMPKTLKGLVQLAEKKGLDLTKITLEQVQAKQGQGSAEATKTELPKAQPLLADPKERPSGIKHIPTEELVQKKQTHTIEKQESAKNAQPLQALLQKEKMPIKQVAAIGKTEQSELPRIQADNRSEQILQKPEQTALKTESKANQSNLKPEQATLKAATKPEPVKTEIRPEHTGSKGEQSTSQTVASPKTTQHNGARSGEQPALNISSEISSDETVKSTVQKPEFSTALNQLLRGNESNEEGDTENRSAETSKPTQTTTLQAKSEALELKMSEAKQMVRHFAGEIKEAIQNYKPPFTRIKIQLNPVKLGEVDVTMVQRGNNVHINISSNAAAINTLAQNATELRTQLSQNGLNNATMNFSSNSNPEQQQQQQRQHLAELYEQFEESEYFDLMESLELIIPRYV